MANSSIPPGVVVGISDPHGRLISLIREHVAEDLILTPSANSGDNADAQMTHLIDKELLLGRSTHIIIMMEDMSSLSVLTGAVRRLLDGLLKCVMVVGPVPLGLLLQTARYDGKDDLLKSQIASGKFLMVEELKPADIEDLLSVT